MKKATRSEKQGSQSQGQNSTSQTEQAPSKIACVLFHLLNIGTLNRFEAERIGDHCLHSTISTLSNSYNITFIREQEKVPTNWGKPCKVTRYGLPKSEHNRAKTLLKFLLRRGGAL